MKRIGVGFTGVPLSIEAMMPYVKLAEKRNFDSAWVAEDYFLRDAISSLACLALTTRRMKLGLGVINPHTRHPVLIAETIAAIDELSKGRCVLGLGTGVTALIQQMGIMAKKPLKAMRESVEVIRRLLAEEEATFRGEVFQIESVKLGANPYFELMGRFRPVRKRIAIYMAAMGPRMFQLAGEVADGVLFSVGTPPSYLEYAVENLKIGAAKAKRKVSEIDLACYVACAPSDRSVAPKAVRGFISFMVAYASEDVLRLIGIEEAEATRIRETLEKNGMGAASKHVSTDMVRSLMAYGTAGDIRERIEEYVSHGFGLPILMPLPPNFRESIEIGAAYARS